MSSSFSGEIIVANPFSGSDLPSLLRININRSSVGGAEWSPADLFAGGKTGFFVDPTQINTLFQDEAGTVPVTAAGDPVRHIADLSGNGNHLTSHTTVGVYRVGDRGGYIEMDGSGAFISPSVAVANTGIGLNLKAASYLYAGAVSNGVNAGSIKYVMIGDGATRWFASGSLSGGIRFFKDTVNTKNQDVDKATVYQNDGLTEARTPLEFLTNTMIGGDRKLAGRYMIADLGPVFMMGNSVADVLGVEEFTQLHDWINRHLPVGPGVAVPPDPGTLVAQQLPA